MRARISQVRIEVEYQCPNCFIGFKLTGSKVPQSKSKSMDCPSCWDSITVPSLSTPKNKKQPNAVNPVIASAINALRSQGYTALEAKDSVNKSYLKDIALATLIKKAILNNELSKTPTV